jgi:hypothetical protein
MVVVEVLLGSEGQSRSEGREVPFYTPERFVQRARAHGTARNGEFIHKIR